MEKYGTYDDDLDDDLHAKADLDLGEGRVNLDISGSLGSNLEGSNNLSNRSIRISAAIWSD